MKAGKFTRIDILCLDCFKGRLIEIKDEGLYCERCGVEFIYVQKGSKVVRYKEEEI